MTEFALILTLVAMLTITLIAAFSKNQVLKIVAVIMQLFTVAVVIVFLCISAAPYMIRNSDTSADRECLAAIMAYQLNFMQVLMTTIILSVASIYDLKRCFLNKAKNIVCTEE